MNPFHGDGLKMAVPPKPKNEFEYDMSLGVVPIDHIYRPSQLTGQCPCVADMASQLSMVGHTEFVFPVQSDWSYEVRKFLGKMFTHLSGGTIGKFHFIGSYKEVTFRPLTDDDVYNHVIRVDGVNLFWKQPKHGKPGGNTHKWLYINIQTSVHSSLNRKCAVFILKVIRQACIFGGFMPWITKKGDFDVWWKKFMTLYNQILSDADYDVHSDHWVEGKFHSDLFDMSLMEFCKRISNAEPNSLREFIENGGVL